MRYKQPLKKILVDARPHWDIAQIRPAVRDNFDRVVKCRTAALGAEVYASTSEKKIVYHTCKSRACPSCGHRATELWQRQQWCALPDIPYAGVCFTMPDLLWPIFKMNRHLLHDLPILGATTIQQWAKAKYGVRVLIMVVPHTFARKLTFNSHLHILVSAGGLRELENRWIFPLEIDKNSLMSSWRFAVTFYLQAALEANLIDSDLGRDKLRALLKSQAERWWSIDVSHFKSKEQFLRYAGRYIRRPPIAQHRFENISDGRVEFWRKDLKQKKRVLTTYSTEEFVELLADQVPDRYRHAVRYYGLLAPRSKAQTSVALFAELGQTRRAPPRRLSWADSIWKHFGIHPLVDRNGRPMRWDGRLKPSGK